MKKMSFTKRIACLMLAALMAIPAASAFNLPEASTVEAASAKKVTMYVGEGVEVGLSRSVKSLKSSNKKIVKTGTYTTYGTKYSYIEAKKKGKCTVSYKKYGEKITYNVNVKKAKISVTATNIGSGNFVLTIKNKTKQYFERVKVNYTVRDAAGAVIESDSVYAYDLPSKGTTYKEILTSATYSQYNAGISCTASAKPDFHDFNYSYKNVSKKIEVTKAEADAEGYLNITYKNKNKESAYTHGSMYVLFYDASGNIVDCYYHSLYVKKGKTESFRAFPLNDYYDYKIVTNAYYTK